jgi:hypothetical protein
MTNVIRKLISIAPVGLGSVLAIAAAPSTASAHWIHFGLGVSLPPIVVAAPAPAPVYADREVRIWVEPVYQTVCDRVWVPDQYTDREVVYYRHGWRHATHEQVLVTPGHFENVNRQVVVTPGHYETHIEHVLVN